MGSEKMTTVHAVKCLKCGDVIYSRATHDFHWCSCGNCAVDGGFDYLRVLGEPDTIEYTDIEVDATRKELRDDWNYRKDKFGLIKGNHDVQESDKSADGQAAEH